MKLLPAQAACAGVTGLKNRHGAGKAEALYLFMKYRKITGDGGQDYLNMNNPEPNMKF